ncbi:MAG TPA: hypothetical protein GX507_03950 [Clostridia bacterium]|nr:hypothetical protein [Clostridia bacterium]
MSTATAGFLLLGPFKYDILRFGLSRVLQWTPDRTGLILHTRQDDGSVSAFTGADIPADEGAEAKPMEV